MSASLHDDAIGSVIAGRYRLDALLGRGAMGAVYRAVDTRTDTAVAVKVMHPGLASDPSIIERFTREAEAASQLDHPNCVQVLAAGSTSTGMRFLVMPLVEGIELRREIKGGMALRRVIDLVVQVLAGLEHAHARGFIHRDVKPENVLLVRDASGAEIAKLVDFGLVKPIVAPTGRRALTAMGKVFGTPWYMAPEQAAGEAIDARADLYAVGVMMFEMLTGAPPFDGDSLAAVLHKHMFAELPALPSWLPAPIAQFLRGLLEKRPEHRPADAASAAAALRHAAARASSQPTIVPELPELSIGNAPLVRERPTSMLRSSQRHGRIFGVLAAAAAAVLLAIGVPHLVEADEIAPAPTSTAIAETVAHAPSTAVPSTPTVQPVPSPVVQPVPASPVPASPVLADAKPAVPTTVAPATVIEAPIVPPRASGAHTNPAPAKPAVKPSRPRADPPRATTPSSPTTPRKLEASRPPRAAGKLPGAGTASGLHRDGGKLPVLRPSRS